MIISAGTMCQEVTEIYAVKRINFHEHTCFVFTPTFYQMCYKKLKIQLNLSRQIMDGQKCVSKEDAVLVAFLHLYTRENASSQWKHKGE